MSNYSQGVGFYTGPRPQQKTSYANKIANNHEWARRCIDYYGAYDQTFNEGEKEKQRKRRHWFNSEFDRADFEKIVNPLNSIKQEFKQWGADLRPFNIMRPIIERLASEYRKRPMGYTIDVNNPDAVSKHEQDMMNEIKMSIRQQFANEVNKQLGDPSGEQTGIPTQQQETPQEIRERYVNMRDGRAVEGTHALELLINETHAKQLWFDGMMDWLLYGDVVTLKEVQYETLDYRKFPSYLCGWDSTTTFIEDGEYCWSREFKPISWVVDSFYDELTEEQINTLENSTQYGYNPNNPFNSNTGGTIDVLHVAWRAFTKIGILTYYDPETGEELTTEVPEEYVASEGESIEWRWINEVWEGYRLDGRIYIRMRPIPYQRRRMDYISSAKLPYNGRVYSNDYKNRISVASIAIPYQILYLSVMRQMELTLSKNKSKVLLIDKNVIPHNDGWDEEKFMYYGQALGYLFINRNQIGADKSFNQYSVLNMSTLDEVNYLIQLATWVEQQLKNTFGITPGREGQFSAKEGTGQRETEMFQSAVISEELFARFDEFLERELQGILDVSKYCFRNGKRAKFVGSDLRTKILDVDPANYSSIEFGVKVSTDPRTMETMKRMQQAVHAFAQNGASPTTILEVLDAQNASMLKEALEKMDAKLQQQQQMQGQQQQQLQQAQAQAAQQQSQQDHQEELEKINLEYDRKLELEQVKAMLIPEPIIPEAQEDYSLEISRADRVSKESIEQRKLDSARQIKSAELLDKQADRMSKEKIAYINAQTALKNKVAGEK